MAGRYTAKGSDFGGWQASGSWPILPCFDLSLVGTFGRYEGTEDDDPVNHTLATYIIGARWTHHWKPFGKEQLPFFQILGGGVDNIREIPGEATLREVRTHAILVFGVGAQPAFFHPKVRLRLQIDVFHRWEKQLGGFTPGGWGAAGSLGLVYRFGPEFECEATPCIPAPVQSNPSARLASPGPPAPRERLDVGAR
jgi:hypothetical protein